MCAPYLEKLKPTFLPWFITRSSVHLTATDFNNFCTAETGKKCLNHAIDEWRRRLLACVDAEGGHFEHYL